MSAARRRAWWIALVLPVVLGPPWVWLLGGWSWAPAVGTWTGCVTVALVATCACTDLTWHKIFNWATYPAALWAVGLNLVGTLTHANRIDGPDEPSVLGHVGLLPCLLGFGVCFFLMLLIYRLARGGAGDVKLAAVLGTLFGLERGLYALALTYLVAAVTLLIWVIWTVGPLVLVVGLTRAVGCVLLPRYIGPPNAAQLKLLASPVPLGVFFAVGAIATLLGVERLWLPATLEPR
jgi:Flp pilus assembly protein protease CpaA